MLCCEIQHAAQLCRMYSELISQSIQTGGPHASKTAQVKSMRSVKKVGSFGTANNCLVTTRLFCCMGGCHCSLAANICLSVRLSVRPSVCLAGCLSVCLSVCPSSVCLKSPAAKKTTNLLVLTSRDAQWRDLQHWEGFNLTTVRTAAISLKNNYCRPLYP